MWISSHTGYCPASVTPKSVICVCVILASCTRDADTGHFPLTGQPRERDQIDQNSKQLLSTNLGFVIRSLVEVAIVIIKEEIIPINCYIIIKKKNIRPHSEIVVYLT